MNVSTISGSSLADACNLGTAINGWRYHREMELASLAGLPGDEFCVKHDRVAQRALTALERIAGQTRLDDPEKYLAVARAARQSWSDLARTEDYFNERAKEVREASLVHGTAGTAAKLLRQWICDDVTPIADRLRREVRQLLPDHLRPYFDLGFSFDQGWRRPDVYAFVELAVGKPILKPHREGWTPWGPLGPTASELRPIVQQIRAARAAGPDGEVEAEVVVDDFAEGDVTFEAEGEFYDVPPGALAPEDGWFAAVREQCRNYGLASAADRAGSLRKACRQALRGELYREEWLLTLVEFRDDLLIELRKVPPTGEKPWPSWERDLWLYEQRKQGLPLKNLPTMLLAPSRSHWGAIETSQISAVVRKVAVYLGDEEMAKARRGRPKKPR